MFHIVEEAQLKGYIPFDEGFSPSLICSNGKPNSSNRWPYQIGSNSRIILRKLYNQKKLLDPSPSSIIGYDKDGYLRGCSLIRINNETCVYIESGMKNYRFPIDLVEVFDELLVITISETTANCLTSEKILTPLTVAKKRILKLKQKIHVITTSSVGEVTTLFDQLKLFRTS